MPPVSPRGYSPKPISTANWPPISPMPPRAGGLKNCTLRKGGSMKSSAASPCPIRLTLLSKRNEHSGQYQDHHQARTGSLLWLSARLYFHRHLFAPVRLLHLHGRRL